MQDDQIVALHARQFCIRDTDAEILQGGEIKSRKVGQQPDGAGRVGIASAVRLSQGSQPNNSRLVR